MANDQFDNRSRGQTIVAESGSPEDRGAKVLHGHFGNRAFHQDPPEELENEWWTTIESFIEEGDLEQAVQQLEQMREILPGFEPSAVGVDMIRTKVQNRISETWGGDFNDWVDHFKKEGLKPIDLSMVDTLIPLTDVGGARYFGLWIFRCFILIARSQMQGWSEFYAYMRAHPRDPDVYRALVQLLKVATHVSPRFDSVVTESIVGSLLVEAEMNLFEGEELRFHRGYRMQSVRQQLEALLLANSLSAYREARDRHGRIVSDRDSSASRPGQKRRKVKRGDGR